MGNGLADIGGAGLGLSPDVGRYDIEYKLDC